MYFSLPLLFPFLCFVASSVRCEAIDNTHFLVVRLRNLKKRRDPQCHFSASSTMSYTTDIAIFFSFSTAFSMVEIFN